MENEKKPLENGFYKMTFKSNYVNYMSVQGKTALRVRHGIHSTIDMAINDGFTYYEKIEKIDRKVFMSFYRKCIKEFKNFID
jgi:hypothetical protein